MILLADMLALHHGQAIFFTMETPWFRFSSSSVSHLWALVAPTLIGSLWETTRCSLCGYVDANRFRAASVVQHRAVRVAGPLGRLVVIGRMTHHRQGVAGVVVLELHLPDHRNLTQNIKVTLACTLALFIGEAYHVVNPATWRMFAAQARGRTVIRAHQRPGTESARNWCTLFVGWGRYRQQGDSGWGPAPKQIEAEHRVADTFFLRDRKVSATSTSAKGPRIPLSQSIQWQL